MKGTCRASKFITWSRGGLPAGEEYDIRIAERKTRPIVMSPNIDVKGIDESLSDMTDSPNVKALHSQELGEKSDTHGMGQGKAGNESTVVTY
jgi:hypothetical protein